MGLRVRVSGLGFRAEGLGFGFRAEGLGFGIRDQVPNSSGVGATFFLRFSFNKEPPKQKR